MFDALKEYKEIFTVVLSSIIGGVFYLIKKNGNSKSQFVKDVNDSNIYQAGGNLNINNGDKQRGPDGGQSKVEK